MSIWIILSWVFVILLTGINTVVFLKLKQAGEQMMKMAFPGAKDMNDAVSRMQQMMQGMSKGAGKFPHMGGGGPMGGGNVDAQLRAAMDMLQKMQKGGKR